MKTILNIVICYDNTREVLKYAKMLSLQKDSDKLSLIIVINKISEDISSFSDNLKNINLDIELIIPGDNLGYMNGLLYGYSHSNLVKKNSYKWIIMSNTDIAINDNNFIQKLITNTYSDDTWCIGPAVFSPNRKSYENPVCLARRSEKKIKLLITIFRIPMLNELYVTLSDYKARIKKTPKGISRYVYEVHGCFFILRDKFATYLYDKTYRALMYSEESFIAEHIFKNGKKVYYDSQLEVIHNEHSVTNSLGRKKIAKYIADSLAIILEDFYS